MTSPMAKERRGIQSIEVGGRLLRALLGERQPMPLSKLAQKAEMPAANAHPYLVSFGKLGLIVQDGESGLYDLGPLALELGLASLHRLNPVRLALPMVAELATTTGHTSALAVWGNRGPTIVHIEQGAQPVHVDMRPGTVMSVVGTATGRVFAAYLPPKLVEHYIKAELREGSDGDGRPPRGSRSRRSSPRSGAAASIARWDRRFRASMPFARRCSITRMRSCWR